MSAGRPIRFEQTIALLGLALLALATTGCRYHSLVRQAEARAGAGDYAGALALYQRAGAEPVRPRENDMAERVARASSEWARRLDAAAQAQAAAGRHGAALLLAAKAAQLSPEPGLVARWSGTRQALLDELRMPVAMGADNALAESVVARAQGLLREYPIRVTLGGQGAADAAALSVRAALREIEIARSRGEAVRTMKYVAKTRMAPNPRHGIVKQQVEATRAQLKTAQQRVREQFKNQQYAEGQAIILRDRDEDSRAAAVRRYGRTQAESAQAAAEQVAARLRTQEEELAKTPEKIEEPIYEDYVLDLVLYNLNAATTMTLTVTPADGPPTTRAVPLHQVIVDEGWDAVAKAKLPANPNNLPTDDQVRLDLEKAAAEKLRDAVLEYYREYREGMRPTAGDAAGTASAAGEITDANAAAIDARVRFMILNAAGGDDKAQEAAAAWLSQASGFADAGELVLRDPDVAAAAQPAS